MNLIFLFLFNVRSMTSECERKISVACSSFIYNSLHQVGHQPINIYLFSTNQIAAFMLTLHFSTNQSTVFCSIRVVNHTKIVLEEPSKYWNIAKWTTLSKEQTLSMIDIGSASQVETISMNSS